MATERQRPPPALVAAVALLAGVSLAYEVLLMRLFSLLQWPHFAYMIISLALLGYGLSGVLLAGFRRRLLARPERNWSLLALGFALGLPLSFLAAQAVPFNPLELLWDPHQWLHLALVYLLLMPPFALVALLVALSLEGWRTRLGQLYGADLAGAGLGALAVVLMLEWFFAESLLLPITVLACLGAALGAVALGRRGAAATALAAGLLAAVWTPAGVLLAPNPFKALQQQLQVQGAELLLERPGALARLSVVASPEVPLRLAPGLSLLAPAEVPEQLALFRNGDGPEAVTRLEGDAAGPAHLDHTPEAVVGELLPPHPRVLLPGAGTGVGVLRALRLGARQVDAVEADPGLAALMTGPLADWSGRLYRRPGVRLHRTDARRFLRQAGERWDLVELPLQGNFSSLGTGLQAVQGNFLLTLEALDACLERLTPRGLLLLPHWVHLPPREGVRLFATAVAVLERRGIDRPGDHLLWLRGPGTAVLLVRMTPFETAELARVRRFARERGFDLAWAPDLAPEETNRFNRLPRPWFHQAAVALLGPEREAFLERYPFRVEPVTDDRPFFHRFFRWGLLPELVRQRRQGSTALQETGYLVLVATLVQATAFSALFLLLPVRAAGPGGGGGRPGHGAYFLLVGLAFMLVEVGAIQLFQRYLAHPLLGVAVVLAGFLVFAGLGARLSAAVDAHRRRQVLGRVLLALPLLAALLPLALDGLEAVSDGWPEPARLAAALALTAAPALLMGFPFTLGLAAVAGGSGGIARAWAVNGFASVTGAVLAALLAVHLGLRTVVWLGALLYLAAAFVRPGPSSRAERGG